MDLYNKSKLEPITSSEGRDFPIFITPELAVKKISDILNSENINESVLFDYISKYYTIILDEVFGKNNPNPSAFKVLMNTKYLEIFLRVLRNVTAIPEKYRIFCNKLCYDYLKHKERPKEKYTESLLLNMSRIVNKSIIPQLLGILPEDLASHIALARYSSLNEKVNAKRMNRVIIHSDPEFMTEQRIIDIYGKLFTKVTHLFEGIMFDVLDEFWSGEEELLYSTINLAILDILESMESGDIRKVLVAYCGDRKMMYPESKVRFSIKSISPTDYPRLTYMIEYLEETEQLYFY